MKWNRVIDSILDNSIELCGGDDVYTGSWRIQVGQWLREWSRKGRREAWLLLERQNQNVCKGSGYHRVCSWHGRWFGAAAGTVNESWRLRMGQIMQDLQCLPVSLDVSLFVLSKDNHWSLSNGCSIIRAVLLEGYPVVSVENQFQDWGGWRWGDQWGDLP